MPLSVDARLPLARPAQEGRHAVGALPVAVLLGAERRDRGVRPGVVVRAVVGRVHDDGVVGDAELVELVEDHADVAVVLDHAVVVLALAADAAVLRLHVGAEVHAGRVPPEEERLVAVCAVSSRYSSVRAVDLVVDGLHALARERAGVLDLLRAVGLRPAVDHAARAEALLEGRVLGVVLVLGLLLGVQVVEVAEELVEAVVGGQVLVEVAEVVLAELGGRVALGLEQLGDGRVLGPEAEVGAGQADLGEPGAQGVLAGDEGGAAGGAALLAVEVGEADALVGEAVDVRASRSPSCRGCCS